MPDDRFRLNDGPLLGRLMRHPDVGGTAYTVRSLAAATGLSYSKIQKLVTEERPLLDEEYANRVAAAVGVRRKALFTPLSFSFENGNDLKEMETPHGPR